MAVRGRLDSEKVRLYYGAKVKTMWIGVARNQATGEQYASIDLNYPPEVFPSVLAVLKEVEGKKSLPKVCIENRTNHAYVAVLFCLPSPSPELLRQIATEQYAGEMASQASGQEAELIMTGEAEFQSGQVEPFMDMFLRQNRFSLFVAEWSAEEIVPAWGVGLTKIYQELPADPA